MTDYQNRAERRSLQRVELRKIRSEYKKRMKGLSEGDKYFYYNPKKFRKTIFYYQLKQSTIGTVASPISFDAPCPANLTIGSPVAATTLSYQSEMSDTDSNTTNSSLFVSGEQSSFDQDAEQDNTAVTYLPKQEKLSIPAAKNHMARNTDISVICIGQNTAAMCTSNEDVSDTFTGLINTPATCAYQEEGPSLQPNTLGQASENTLITATCKEESPSLQTNTPVVIVGQAVAEDIPVIVIPKEEGPSLQNNTLMVLYDSDQVANDTCAKRSSLQTNALVVSDDIGQVVPDASVVDISNEGSSTQTNTPVALDDVEKAEDIPITEILKEDVAFQSDTIPPLCTDTGISATPLFECSPEVDSFNSAPGEDKQCVADTSIQVSNISEQTYTEKESGVADTLGSEVDDIAADKAEGDAVKTSGLETGTITVMADKEKKADVIAKDLAIIPDFDSFKLEWNALSPLSVHMFDDILGTFNELQARTDALVNAADPEDTETSENKEDKEESLDVNTEAEEKEDEWPEERSAISSKKINSGFSEKPTRETAWMVTPPSSIMSALCEETTSLVTPPQSITNVVFNKSLSVQPSITGKVEEAVAASAIQEVTFSLSTRGKKNRLRNLRNKTGAVVPKIKKVWKRLFN